MIGLTATPRNEENKSTYEMFELKNGHPDFAYELEAAIDDKYLVGFSVLDKTTDAMRRGVYYDELTDEEKAELDEIIPFRFEREEVESLPEGATAEGASEE
jgi:type I restriction enzyme R subunit